MLLFLNRISGYTADGIRLNQPAGHLEAGESLLQAVIRKTREETGYHFKPDCLVGFYRWHNQSNDMTFLRCVFAGSEYEPIPQAELDQGIIRAVWMSREELLACPDKHRSPLVMQCITDWIVSSRYNLSLLKDLG